MAEYKLTLEKREITGKKTKSLRKSGMIPSVVYGGKTPILLASDYVATEKVLEGAGYHSPIDLTVDGKKKLAIVKDVHIDPVSRMIINVEFQAISAREVVEATTPVVITGFEESEASVAGLAITQAIEELDIKAKPADLPKEITIDASKLKTIEDKITLADIKLPEGVTLADKEPDLEQVIASLYDPVAEAEKREAKAAAEAAEAAAEAESETEESATPESEETQSDTNESQSEEKAESAEESA